MSDGSEQNVKEQCKEACFPGGIISDVPAGKFVISSQTCLLDTSQETSTYTGNRLTDEEKKQIPRKSKSISTYRCFYLGSANGWSSENDHTGSMHLR